LVFGACEITKLWNREQSIPNGTIIIIVVLQSSASPTERHAAVICPSSVSHSRWLQLGVHEASERPLHVSDQVCQSWWHWFIHFIVYHFILPFEHEEKHHV